MAHSVPPLPYDYNALEPHIDEQTMRIHHDKHHAAYVTNLNAALEKHPELKTPRNLSRMYGRLAFAHAASGEAREARSWARRSIGLNWRQPRGYISYLVSWGVLRPSWVVKAAHAVGRGV